MVDWSASLSNWTPSIVPRDDDRNVYLVVDDLGRYGLVWREADFETTDLETVIQDLMTGQYNNPIRVVSFNTAEGWSSDVSADVALGLIVVAEEGVGPRFHNLFPQFQQRKKPANSGRSCPEESVKLLAFRVQGIKQDVFAVTHDRMVSFGFKRRARHGPRHSIS